LVAALLTSTSTPPYSDATDCTSSRIASSLPVWQAREETSCPHALFILSAAACRPSSLREAITTRAPCMAKQRAIDSPMPRLAPVTMATLPARSIFRGDTGVWIMDLSLPIRR
jgi:hypothetical protein